MLNDLHAVENKLRYVKRSFPIGKANFLSGRLRQQELCFFSFFIMEKSLPAKTS